MRSPTRSLAGQLRWTRSGTVWADWLLRPLPYGFRPDKDKHAIRGVHQALFRALPGESLLLGVCAPTDPATVVEKMIAGVDLAACPDWAAECEATLDTLDAIAPGERVYWLSVPLGAARARDRVTEPLRAAAADLRDTMALPRAGVPAGELARRCEQARRVAAAIPAPLAPRAATPAQMVWLHACAQQRGLAGNPELPVAGSGDLAGQLLTPRSGVALGEPLLDEGGRSDAAGGRWGWNPLAHRYLKVCPSGRPGEAPASYQALLVLTDVPAEGMAFPGSEFVGRIDESGLDVDWAMRLQVRSSIRVAAANRKALVNLNEQYGQREGELSHGLGTLDRAAAELAEYAAILEGDKLEVEAQATTVFAVAGPDPATATAQAGALAGYLGAAGFALAQPLGYQEELWWSMQPGVPATKAVREFAQITTSAALAAAVPLASAELGDDRGSLIGMNITTGRPGVVLHDIAGAAARDVSGSLAVAGELGSGKALAVDTPIPTPRGWTRMGDLAPGDQVFDEQGRPTAVRAVSPVMVDRRCFDVVFSDGTQITADAEHLWTTVPDRVRGGPAKRNYKIRKTGGRELADLAAHTEMLSTAGWVQYATTSTTQQVRESLLSHGQSNHAIPTAGALELPPADLPVDPYVLGCWLGDGHSGASQITSADPEVLAFIEEAGYRVTRLSAKYHHKIAIPSDPPPPAEFRPCACCGVTMKCTYSHRRYCSRQCASAARRAGAPLAPKGICSVCGRGLGSGTGRRCDACRRLATLRGQLRALGVLGNKHIPAVYLRASRSQRAALLAGLLDTDGTVAPSGAIELTNTCERLAMDARELACTLGYRAALRQYRARLDGRDCGPAWTVSFTTRESVFCLSRKRDAQAARTSRSSAARNCFRYVMAVREVSSVPVRCIRIANPVGLFLAGSGMIPTHNSLTLKSLAGDVVDRGGQVIAVDRTAMGEYATWAASVTRALVVDVADPTVSLDPLRLFGPATGSRVTQSFLTPLLNVAPTSERGVLLSDVLDSAYLATHRIRGLGGLLAHLRTDCALAGAGELARVMNVFARRDFGRVIFDDALPPLPLASPAVVIRTATLELPSAEELTHRHLFDQLGLEKLFGRALYALIAALARRVCFADRTTLGVFLVDETHHVTASPEGEREIVEFVRDGRKHAAAVLLGSHDPAADFGSPTLRGLIPTRILLRHRDKTLARRGLAWLDLDPDDDELVALLTEQTSPVGPGGVEEHRRGEAFLRDSSANVGRCKVLAPSRPERDAAVRTSPPEVSGLPGATL